MEPGIEARAKRKGEKKGGGGGSPKKVERVKEGNVLA